MAIQTASIQAILFDIDGTLSDSDNRLVQKVSHYLSPFITNKDHRTAFARWIVMGVESPGNFLYNLADRFSIDSYLLQMLNWISKRKKHPVKDHWLIPGIADMLEELMGYRLAVVSARDAHSTMSFLAQFSLDPFFDVVVTSQTCHYTKPFPDPMLYAAEKMGVPAASCLMVGDTTVDMKAAKLAGMQAVGVLCGFGREKELLRAGADLILPITTDLSALFQG